MSFTRVRETFMHLPKQIKFIGIGSLILGISTFLPWYADLDSYKIGDEFLGVTGPASFVGIVILLLAGLSMWIFSCRLLGKRVPRLPVREAILHLFVSIESIFLLILTNSIFFHPKFGVNITLKESRFGMTLAFLGAAVLLIGAFLQNREELKRDREIGKLEPLIKLDSAPSQMQVSPEYSRQHSPVRQPLKEEPKRNLYAKEETRGFLFGEKSVDTEQAKTVKDERQSSSGSGSYMLRMDK